MQEKYTEVFPLRLTSRMYKDIKACADREFLSIAQYMRKVLREATGKDRK